MKAQPWIRRELAFDARLVERQGENGQIEVVTRETCFLDRVLGAVISARGVRAPEGATCSRATAFTTGPADTFFSIPAFVRVAGRRVRGFLTRDDGIWTFHQ